MADLISIGYRDMRTAPMAMDDVAGSPRSARVRPDAVAAIIRDESGRFTTITNVPRVEDGTTYAIFWSLLFSHLFFVPFLGMRLGASLEPLVARTQQVGIARDMETGVRDSLKPGTSALFAIVESRPDAFLRVAAPYGGSVMRSPISADALTSLQDALHGPTRGGAAPQHR